MNGSAYGSSSYGGGERVITPQAISGYEALSSSDLLVDVGVAGDMGATGATPVAFSGDVTVDVGVSGSMHVTLPLATTDLTVPVDLTAPGMYITVPLTSDLTIDVQASGGMALTSPAPAAFAGSITDNTQVFGDLSTFTTMPDLGVVPIPPATPPPPPSASINDGGTIPLLPAGRVLTAVYAPDGTTLISYVPRAFGQQWLNEMNAPGSGTFQIHLDDETFATYMNLLDQFNIVKFSINGVKVKAWIIEDVSPVRVSSSEAAGRIVTVSGRGVMAGLESAVVYPEYGLRQFAPQERLFTFAAKDGVWRVEDEWDAPVGVLWTADTTARKTFPTGWPDPLAYWLWSTSPVATAPAGRNWFRAEFTLTERTNVKVFAAADNAASFYLDGIMFDTVGLNDTWAFKKASEYTVTLDEGLHTLAAQVDNFVSSAINPGGLLMTIMGANSVGEATTENVFRMTPSNTIVKAYGDAPGWRAINVLEQCIIEAQERQVTALVPFTFSFTSEVDTAGTPWTDRQDRTVNVGTTDLLDLATQLIEVAFDLEVTPDLVVNAWVRRGLDYGDTVRILPGRDLTDAAATIRGGRLKNQALLKSGSGWVELSSPASKTAYGRREVGLSVGNAGSTDQLITVGSAAMQEVSRPETTIPISYTSVRGPQPHVDYDLGDIIKVPDAFEHMIRARVMSIAGSQGETAIEWSVDFYPADDVDVIDQVVVGVGDENGDPDALYQAAVLSDSPWGYWRLKETTGTVWSDLSGNNRPMTNIEGAATLGTTGPVNKAVTWSDGAGYGTVGSTKTFQQGIVTVECWINIPSLPFNPSVFLGMAVGGRNGSSHDKELLVRPDGKLSWYTSSGGPSYVTSPSALALDTWYHVVGSVGPDGSKLYIDGQVVASDPSRTTSYATNAQHVMLHAGGNTLNGHGAMRVAEPAIYFQQLHDSRILAHYESLTL